MFDDLFEYEEYDDVDLIDQYRQCTMLRDFGHLKEGDYLAMIEFNVETLLFSIYEVQLDEPYSVFQLEFVVKDAGKEAVQ